MGSVAIVDTVDIAALARHPTLPPPAACCLTVGVPNIGQGTSTRYQVSWVLRCLSSYLLCAQNTSYPYAR